MNTIRNAYLTLLLGAFIESYAVVYKDFEWLAYVGFALCMLGGLIILGHKEGTSEETMLSLKSNNNWQCFIVLLLMFFKKEESLLLLISEFMFRAFLFTAFLRIVLFFKRGSNNKNDRNDNSQVPPTTPPRLTT